MRLINIIRGSEKILTISDLLVHLDAVLELAKDDVQMIAIARHIVFPDFDFLFSTSIKMLKIQLQKKHLKAIKKFHGNKNIEDAARWLTSRILNNMRNLSTNSKYKLYVAPKFQELHENIESDDQIEKSIELFDLKKIDKEVIKKALRQVWQESIFDNDFDAIDFQDLCKKFKLTPIDVLEFEIKNIPEHTVEQAASGNSQLVFIF